MAFPVVQITHVCGLWLQHRNWSTCDLHVFMFFSLLFVTFCMSCLLIISCLVGSNTVITQSHSKNYWLIKSTEKTILNCGSILSVETPFSFVNSLFHCDDIRAWASLDVVVKSHDNWLYYVPRFKGETPQIFDIHFQIWLMSEYVTTEYDVRKKERIQAKYTAYTWAANHSNHCQSLTDITDCTSL